MNKVNNKKEVKRILGLLTAAVVFAGLLTAFMLYLYNPSGRYLAKNTLLAPDVINQINIRDRHPQTGQNVRFVFDQSTFSYYDSAQRRSMQEPVSLEAYQIFYQQVASEKSLTSVSEKVLESFNRSQPTLLMTHLRTDVIGGPVSTKVFQVVQFTPEGYFRIRLHGTGSQSNEEWAYFYLADSYPMIMRLFISKQASQL